MDNPPDRDKPEPYKGKVDSCLGGALDCEQPFDALLLNVLGESVEQ
ncbi:MULTISPECIES: hypothetical protein [Vibrio]|nr:MULTISPECIES: hypothetical protein [Vibrio]EDL67440.1 hypothetical protein A1Q_4545 [Vibrio campbellii HY01]EHR5466063.1 hypothetical protein [Vibrio parahaemolyticus]QJT70769.1 hypothetical protein [Vibrio phage HY01]EIO2938086.1 hypothetical protein [Vibrio parahaemolyticus]EJG0221696.1 hypothetical protein [Vibrio parahaemolyticus]